MDFLTTEYVAEQAKLGELPTLKCSLEHHQQGRDADWMELGVAIKAGVFNIHAKLCSCCQKFKTPGPLGTCGDCPLYTDKGNKRCCRGTWKESELTFNKLELNYSNANFKAFQEAEAKVCTYIEGVIAKKEAEQKSDKRCFSCEYEKIKSDDHPCLGCMGTKSKPNFTQKKSPPALRHADYGHCKGTAGQLRIFVEDIHGKIRHYEGQPCSVDPCSTCPEDGYIILGNIFDDLARNAVDLESWEMGYRGKGDDIASYIAQGGDIVIRIGKSHFPATIDQATEIAHKILQEVATARRKQSKK